MSDKRIGVMGCGVVADYGHVPSLKQAAGVTPVAVFDPMPGAAAKFAKRHSIAHHADNLDDFFAFDLDAVVVASPAPTHLANVLAAAERKLPILCEKPLAMDDAEMAQMVNVCEAAGVPLVCGFCYRFAKNAQQIKRFVDDGAIGQVRSLRLIYNWDCHGKYYINDQGEWVLDGRRVARMEEGGPLFDCGTHQIDLARWWLGAEVVEQTAKGAWVEVDDYVAPDHVWLHMDLSNGAHACVEMSYSYGHTTKQKFSEFVYELIGTDGMIRYHRETSQFELRTHQFTERLPYHEEKSFTGMHEAFSGLLHHGVLGDLCTAREAMEVTRIARLGTEQAIAERPAVTVAPPATPA